MEDGEEHHDLPSPLLVASQRFVALPFKAVQTLLAIEPPSAAYV